MNSKINLKMSEEDNRQYKNPGIVEIQMNSVSNQEFTKMSKHLTSLITFTKSLTAIEKPPKISRKGLNYPTQIEVRIVESAKKYLNTFFFKSLKRVVPFRTIMKS